MNNPERTLAATRVLHRALRELRPLGLGPIGPLVYVGNIPTELSQAEIDGVSWYTIAWKVAPNGQFAFVVREVEVVVQIRIGKQSTVKRGLAGVTIRVGYEHHDGVSNGVRRDFRFGWEDIVGTSEFWIGAAVEGQVHRFRDLVRRVEEQEVGS